ncbi:MAG: hypothetical protein HQ526_10720 [Actinobacteria bacterium]|nr:hypothetical protein [Actinomycetota bacterium]
MNDIENSENGGIDLRSCWQRPDSQIHADAVAFWASQQLLPEDVDPLMRAKELIAVAYSGDRLVGVTTGVVGPLAQLRRDFVFLRCSVDANARRSGIAYQLTDHAIQALAGWAHTDPGNQVAGVAAIVESPEH